jgi:hypothetical protein
MNPADPTISLPKKGSFKRTLWRIVVACFLLALTVFGIWRLRLSASIRAQVAAIRQQGLPVDWKDLEQWPATVPDDKNAAMLIEDALFTMDDKQGDKIARWTLPIRGGAITNRDEIAQCVRSNHEAMEVICGVTNAESSHFSIDYMEGPNAKLPHLTGIKTFSQLFAGDALLKADQNDPAGAVRDIEASLTLSRSLDGEPILISQLVSGAVLRITTDSIERTLARTSFSDEQLSRLGNELTAAEATNRCWIAMVGERASGGELMRMLSDDPRGFIMMANKMSKDDQTDVPPRYYHGYLISLSGFWQRDRDYFLRAMSTNIAALAATPPASLRFTNEFEAIYSNAFKTFHVMSAMLLPSFNGVVNRDADCRAKLRTTIAAIAVERWRAAHGGKIPDSLSELVPSFLPAIPQDPYDGQPLRFKKLSKGYVVYSIGPNGQDDGGKEMIPYSVKVPQEERSRYDITFIVER